MRADCALFVHGWATPIFLSLRPVSRDSLFESLPPVQFTGSATAQLEGVNDLNGWGSSKFKAELLLFTATLDPKEAGDSDYNCNDAYNNQGESSEVYLPLLFEVLNTFLVLAETLLGIAMVIYAAGIVRL